MGLKQLRDDEQILTLDCTLGKDLLQCLPDLCLVAVASGAVDEPVTGSDGCLHCRSDFPGLSCQKGAKSEAGHHTAGIEGNGTHSAGHIQYLYVRLYA